MRLVARYRTHGDPSAEVVEVTIEADEYEDAVAQAKARTAETDDLLSVQVVNW